MVDLAFLLITFFMLTTSLSKPKSMQLSMPDAKGEPSKVDENRTMTILLGADNKAQCFMGKFNGKPQQVVLGNRELRQQITANQKSARAYSSARNEPQKGLIVLIKPGKQSQYGNLVDVLDEMAICDIASYAITDLEKPEKDFLLAQK